VVNEVAQRRLNGGPPASTAQLLFASGDWLVYAFLTPAVFGISRRWPLSRPHLMRHALLHLSVSLAFCAAWAGAGAVLRAVLMPEALYGGAGMHFVSWLFITLPFGVAVYLAVAHRLRPVCDPCVRGGGDRLPGQARQRSAFCRHDEARREAAAYGGGRERKGSSSPRRGA
jgi:hypothetical protein